VSYWFQEMGVPDGNSFGLMRIPLTLHIGNPTSLSQRRLFALASQSASLSVIFMAPDACQSGVGELQAAGTLPDRSVGLAIMSAAHRRRSA
jgi:hypothetical protein